MSITVAVALITAISTLAGAGISGYISYRVSLVQGKSSQDERHSTEMRQVRRDAYMQYLNQVATAEQRLDNLWQSRRPVKLEDIEEFLKPARTEVSNVERLANLVILEGPHEVAHAAMALGVWMTLEISDLARTASKVETGAAICYYAPKEFERVSMQRHKAKMEMITAAQASLGVAVMAS